MATSEILGLFTTPEQYQLAQQQAQEAQALQYARLDPAAQAQYGFYRAGQQLGGAIGGALGGEDPQLKLISQRQQLLSQLDQSDPTSFARVAKIASDAGDQQLALGIANAGRQAAIQIAQANKEKQLAVNPDILKSQTSAQIQDNIDQYKLLPPSPERDRTIKLLENQYKVLNPEKPEATSTEMKNAAAIADSVAQRGTEAWNTRYNTELNRLTTKESKQDIPKVGVARLTGEVVYYDKNQDLQFIKKRDPNDPTKQIRVPFEGDVDQTTSKVSSTSTSTTGGVDKFRDIPDLRAKIVGVVDPFRKAVNATDMALESLDLSMTQNNFAGFNAARVQLAKALSGGDLSQKEIAAAGGDPSIFGKIIDTTSTLFTSTPSIDTQQKIKDTIKAIRKVALKKGRDEIEVQRNIASRSGFNKDDFEAASNIPEFQPRNKKPPAEIQPFDADKEKRYQEYKAKELAKQSGATK
jgi:hypothetical protein